MLTEAEQSAAAQAVRDLIVGSGLSARHLRVVGPGLYGSDDVATNAIGEIAIELVEAPAVDLGNHVDATAHVLPDVNVIPTDRLMLNEKTYRVQTVKPHNLFSAVTHQQLDMIELN